MKNLKNQIENNLNFYYFDRIKVKINYHLLSHGN